MPGRYAGHAGARRTSTGTAPRDEPLLLAKRREPEIVRVFLRPFDAALCAIDAQAQRIFIAGRNLTAPKHALGTTRKTQHHMRIVVQATSFDKTVEISGKAVEHQAGHEGGKIEGVRANIAGRAA
ncbi:hypothetical protein D3C80_1816450 [compost metagenome]